MSDLVGNQEDWFSHVAANLCDLPRGINIRKLSMQHRCGYIDLEMNIITLYTWAQFFKTNDVVS